jgi:Ca2+-binding EF-hand superfamily protein
MKLAQWRLPLLLGPIVCFGLAELARGAGAEGARPAAAPDVEDLVILGPLRPLIVRLHVTIDGQPFRELWQQRFDELFVQQDRDQDGRVTVEQGDSIARDMNGGLRDTPRSVAKDSPLRSVAASDGTVDRRTLAMYVQKILPPFTLHARAVISQSSALALFPLLDANGDHQLSEQELSAAEEQLKQRDFNDDGVITGFELILDPNAIAAASDPAAGEATGGAHDPPAFLLGGMTHEEVADRLLKRYDRNADGRVMTSTAERELNLPETLAGRLDTNGDGALVREELLAFADRQADLELSLAMGRVSTVDRRGRTRVRAESGWRVRAKLDGGYKLNLGEIDIDFNRNNRNPQQADLFSFSTFDRDNNGYVDENEANANNIGRAAFEAMDVDGDKKVVKGEFTSFLEGQNAAAAIRLQLEVSDIGQDLFALLDTDVDGVLSPRELRTAKNVLAVEDKNGDGLLNSDEIPQRMIFDLVRGAEAPSDTDARLIRGHIARSAAKASTTGPRWFRKMDRNNDGDLSPREFVGPLDAFQKIDTDGDGLIDRDEAEAAGK